MSEINREDAIANVALAIWHYPNELYTSLNCFENCQELAERALNCLPSAEPERMKGKWIFVHPLQSDDPGAYMCSECKMGMWEIIPSVYRYCPNCGSYNGGEEE